MKKNIHIVILFFSALQVSRSSAVRRGTQKRFGSHGHGDAKGFGYNGNYDYSEPLVFSNPPSKL